MTILQRFLSKRRLFCSACFPVALWLSGATASIAESPISVKSVLREDGTRVVTTTNLDEKTAEASTYTGKDTLVQKVVYRLNDANQADTGTVYDGKGKFLYKMALTYDSSGRVGEEVDSDASGRVLRRLVYGYDAQGRLRKVDAYDGAGNVMTKNAAKKDVKQRPPRRR